MKVLSQYKNGNYNVLLLNNGTKIRYNNATYLEPEKPENIDLKITNYCTKDCEMCYASSSKCGKHGDIINLKFVDTMLPGSEVSIGGGNALAHPDLEQFLKRLRDCRLIANITVDQDTFVCKRHYLKKLQEKELIHGVGISVSNPSNTVCQLISDFPNAVAHVINGMVTLDELKMMRNRRIKVLILGYKVLGRGKELYHHNWVSIEKRKIELFEALPAIVKEGWFEVVSFDNLAIDQLEPRRFLSYEQWEQMYLGNDGFCSMYVDAVEQKFAQSSTSTVYYDLQDNIKNMFEKVRRY